MAGNGWWTWRLWGIKKAVSASGLYCKKLGVASRLHMYLTDSKLNLPVQTARKLVLAPFPFDDYLEMNPTRRSRIFVHRVSAINKPKNTLRPDNPGGGGGGGGGREERQSRHRDVSIRLPTVSLGFQVPQATPYVCCVVLLLVLALSLKNFFPGTLVSPSSVCL